MSAEAIICIENEAYPPLINGTNTIPADEPGYSIRIAQEAAQDAELSIEFIRRPWARCLQLVTSGKADGLLPSIKTDERKQLYRFPNDNKLFLTNADYHLFYSRKDKNADFYETLVNTKDKSTLSQAELKYGIAAPYGYIAHGMLKELKLLSSHDYALEKGLKMVASGKLDGYVVIKAIGEQKVFDKGLNEQLTTTQQPFLHERLYVAFNNSFYKNNQSKVDKFWQSLPNRRLEILGY